MKTREFRPMGVRFSIEKEGQEIAHAYLYILTNDLHQAPFGLLEDVHVESGHRSAGSGRDLLKAVFDRAKAERCYKLIATSRDDGSRQSVHDWYLRLGFRDYGTEFRIDL